MKGFVPPLLILVALALTACNFKKSPLEVTAKTSEGELSVLLPRSQSIEAPFEVSVPALSWEWTGNLFYRTYQSDSDWLTMLFWVNENQQMVSQPQLPKAPEKGYLLEYFIELSNASTGELIRIPKEGTVVLEFY